MEGALQILQSQDNYPSRARATCGKVQKVVTGPEWHLEIGDSIILSNLSLSFYTF